MDQLFASGMKLAYDPIHSFVFEKGNERELSKVRRMNSNCPSIEVCVNWAKNYKHVSVFLPDHCLQIESVNGYNVGENGETLLCKIDDGVFFNVQSVMIMLYGEPLLKRINDIFGRAVEAGLYKFWLSEFVSYSKIVAQKIAIVNHLDEYYSFNLYHMQPAFYLFLIGLCMSVFCFVIELFCFRL
jgi:hypothetical protein